MADPDLYVFGLPESGSISMMYESDSETGSFYQAKIVRKTFIPTVLWLLYDLLSLKTDEPSKSNKQKNLEDHWRKWQDPDPHPDPLVRGMDPRIRIRNKISWICNTGGRDCYPRRYKLTSRKFKWKYMGTCPANWECYAALLLCRANISWLKRKFAQSPNLIRTLVPFQFDART